MTLYAYHATKLNGSRYKGVVRANSLAEAQRVLRKKKLKIDSLVEKPETFANKEISFGNKISEKILARYLYQLSTLIGAGIPVLESSIMMEEEQKNKALKKILAAVVKELKNGQALSQAYRLHPEAFPTLLVNTVEAAEISGTLEATLGRMTAYYEKRQKTKSSIVTALMYPIVMLVAALGVGTFLLVSIVPMFVGIFESFDAELPPITKVTLKISEFIQSKGVLVIFSLIGLGLLFFFANRNEKIHYYYDTLKLKLPLFGVLIQKSNFSLFMSTFSSLIGSSVPLPKALELTRDVVQNVVVKDFAFECQRKILQGDPLSGVFEEASFVPSMATQMVKVGESTGSLEDMLYKLSKIFEDEVEQTSQRLKTIMEPLIIVVICVIVGFIVAAIMIPMFTMYGTMQG